MPYRPCYIICVYGWCIMLLTCSAQLTFHLLIVNPTTDCTNSHRPVLWMEHQLLFAGYLSITNNKATSQYLAWRRGIVMKWMKYYTQIHTLFNDILPSKIIWSKFLLYFILYKQISIWIDMVWSKSQTMVKTTTKMPHTGNWINEQLNENLNDILLI